MSRVYEPQKPKGFSLGLAHFNMKINYIVLFFVGLIVTSICFSYPVKSILSVKNLEYIEKETATYTASDYIQEGLIAFYKKPNERNQTL